jgi:steroid 5-alpha reductase family enzyme
MAAFPLLLIPFLLINVLIFFVDGGLAKQLFTATLPSGSALNVTAGDLAVLVGLVFLYFEILKSTRTGQSSIIDHALSLALFVTALLEFLLAKGAGNMPFLLLTIMTLIDVIAGFTVSISVARRDVGFSTRSE